MSKRDAGFYIVDIWISIYKIEIYTQSFKSAEELKWSSLEWDASLRQLEIIGEATKHLIAMNILDNQKYRKIVDFRNLISHGYFGIDEDEVWYVIQYKLKEFKCELEQVTKEQNISILDAVKFAKVEYRKDKQLIDFLERLHV